MPAPPDATPATPLPLVPSPASLLSAAAVRGRAKAMLRRGLEGRLRHFAVDLDRLGACADEVVRTIRADYPTLDVPFHARWRHFAAGGFDRWGTLEAAHRWPDMRERARAAFDLAIVSVLLDAGAGPGWSFDEGRTGERFGRSEGLAVASFDAFLGGAFSGRPAEPFRVDAAALEVIGADELGRLFQVAPDNPIVGLPGRVELLRRLGRTVMSQPEVFGAHDDPRPGGLFDHLAGRAENGRLRAPDILRALLDHLGPVWPGRIAIDGVDLGDTWRYDGLGEGPTAGLVPFHKLSQWLAYSLIEPLEEAGFTVTELDGLTGLPEYRNGGLFVDTGVLRLTDPEDAGRPHDVGSALVVEWRALTVALLDRIAVPVRATLRLDAEDFPLAKVLEGGTWATGRRLARALRADGASPIAVASDGTVF